MWGFKKEGCQSILLYKPNLWFCRQIWFKNQRQEKVVPRWSSPPSRVWRCVSCRAPHLPLPKDSMGCCKTEHSYQSLSPSSSLSPVSLSVRNHPHPPFSVSQPEVPIHPLPSFFSIVLTTFWLPYHNLPKVISKLYTGYLCMIYCIHQRLTLRSRTYFFLDETFGRISYCCIANHSGCKTLYCTIGLGEIGIGDPDFTPLGFG